MTISNRELAYLSMLGSVCLLVYTLRKGEVGIGGFPARRKDDPLMFWFVWLFFFAMVLLALSALILTDLGVI